MQQQRQWTANDIFKFVGMLVCWGLAIIVGLVVFITLAEGLIAFASTGVGAIILVAICLKLYSDKKKEIKKEDNK